MNELQKAEKIAAENVNKRPSDAMNWVWYGQMQWANGKKEEALDSFRQAVTIDPSQPGTWNALFNYYVQLTDLTQAKAALDTMVDKVDLDAGRRAFILAQGHERLNLINEANASYDKAIAENPNAKDFLLRQSLFHLQKNLNLEKAESALRRILKIEPDDLRSKRLLARVLGALGGSEQWKEVKQLLSDKSDMLSQREKALLLAYHPDQKARKEARELLFKIVNDFRYVTDADRLVLAKLYVEASNDKTLSSEEKLNYNKLAKNQLLDTVATENPTPKSLNEYISFLIDNGFLKEANLWIAKLEKLAETDMDALRLRAKTLYAQNDINNLIILVEKTADKQILTAKTEDEKNSIATKVAMIYSQFELHSNAEKWYRVTADLTNEGFATLTYNLAMQGKPVDAIQIALNKAQKQNHKNALAGMVVASILTRFNIPPNLVESGYKTLSKIEKNNTANIDLLMAIGNLHAIRQKNNDAVSYYEKVLSINDRHPEALNNLATIFSEMPEKQAEALAHIDRAILTVGRRPSLADTKGMILLQMGQNEKAMTELLFAVQNDKKNDSRFRFHLAIAYHKSKQLKNAREQFHLAYRSGLASQFLTGKELSDLAQMKKEYGTGTP